MSPRYEYGLFVQLIAVRITNMCSINYRFFRAHSVWID